MVIKKVLRSATLAATVLAFPLLSMPASAQPEQAGPPDGDTVFDGTYATIGMGISLSPSYEGSDNYVVSPLPVILGSIDGIEIEPRGPGVAADFIRDDPDSRVEAIFGPVGRARINRVNRINDPVVRSLGKLDVSVELGAFAGLKVNRVLNPFDSLTAQADIRWDVAGAHSGRVISPTLSYFTPLNRGTAINFSINADHVDDDYADYYFSVSPAGNVASGLPVFAADGGWNSVGTTLLTFFDLDGNGMNGGFSIILLGSYSRLLNDAKRSPITSIRGDADQWFGAVGVGYTF